MLWQVCSTAYVDMGQAHLQRGCAREAHESYQQAVASSRYLPELKDALLYQTISEARLEFEHRLECAVST